MPEMSGLEATAVIRAGERDTGRHTPIVALTARAMAGDREQCLAAGMDGYVSKPVRAPELFATIEALVGAGTPPEATPSSEAPPEASPEATSAIDVTTLLAGFGGRADLVTEVIDVFVDDAPAMLERLKNAAHASDVAELGAAAHAIKGSVGLFSQGDTYQRAKALELRARSGDGSAADTAFEEIDASVSRLITELRQVRATLART